MNIFKKKSFIFSIVIIFIGFISFSFSATTFQVGLFEQNIFNPLNIIVANSNEVLKSNSITNFQTTLETVYSKFDDYGGDWNPTNSYTCIVGGNYLLQILSNPSNSGFFNQTVSLFYCKTTQDLINQIKIPTSWQNDNLILYCNDGQPINYLPGNFDFITSKLNSYKSCILKNLDTQNTILYGFDVGNVYLENDKPQILFNSTTNKGSIINSNLEFINKVENSYLFKDRINKQNYYLKYNKINSFYSFSDSNKALNLSLNLIFNKDIGISRIALFKHFSSNDKNIYGYETAINSETNFKNSKIIPVYKINYGNSIPLNSKQCSKYLQKYDAKNTGNLKSSDKIICRGIGSSKEILINSNAIDSEKYGKTKVNSFNIFKNIILSLNNN